MKPIIIIKSFNIFLLRFQLASTLEASQKSQGPSNLLATFRLLVIHQQATVRHRRTTKVHHHQTHLTSLLALHTSHLSLISQHISHRSRTNKAISQADPVNQPICPVSQLNLHINPVSLHSLAISQVNQVISQVNQRNRLTNQVNPTSLTKPRCPLTNSHNRLNNLAQI